MVAPGQREVQTVLVVEDDPHLLSTYTNALERSGKRAWGAESSAGARELFRAHKPDACIVDMQLGSEDGIELIRELREHDPGVVLVLVTGYGSLEAGANAVLAGADYVLSKPIRLHEILDRLGTEQRAEPGASQQTPTLDRAIWEHIQRVLRDCGGNKSEAARRLRVDRGTLHRWLVRDAPRS